MVECNNGLHLLCFAEVNSMCFFVFFYTLLMHTVGICVMYICSECVVCSLTFYRFCH